jgi:hypothetical protein
MLFSLAISTLSLAVSSTPMNREDDFSLHGSAPASSFQVDEANSIPFGSNVNRFASGQLSDTSEDQSLNQDFAFSSAELQDPSDSQSQQSLGSHAIDFDTEEVPEWLNDRQIASLRKDIAASNPHTFRTALDKLSKADQARLIFKVSDGFEDTFCKSAAFVYGLAHLHDKDELSWYLSKVVPQLGNHIKDGRYVEFLVAMVALKSIDRKMQLISELLESLKSSRNIRSSDGFNAFGFANFIIDKELAKISFNNEDALIGTQIMDVDADEKRKELLEQLQASLNSGN